MSINTDVFRKVFRLSLTPVCWVLCRLESPTRTLSLEAPKGVEVNAGVGEFKASCRKDLTLESTEGDVSPARMHTFIIHHQRSHTLKCTSLTYQSDETCFISAD